MSEQNLQNKALFDSLMSAELPVINTTGGTNSFRIVNSNGNGKRIELSKALVESLGLSNQLCLMPSAEKAKLVIGKTLPFLRKATLTLSSGGRIAYSAQMVKLLEKTFNINFSNTVSRTFDQIEFDVIDDVPVAIVDFSNAAVPVAVRAAEEA